MKRKISMAFLIFGLLTIYSVLRIYLVFPAIFQSLRYASVLDIISYLYLAVDILLPIGIFTLLCLNQQHDVKKMVNTVLIIAGITYLCGLAISIKDLFNLFAYSEWVSIVMSLINYAIVLFTGLVCLFTASSIRQEKRETRLTVCAAIAFYLNLLPLGLSIILGAFSVVSLIPCLLVAGIALLPKTFYDHENCVFVTKSSMKVVLCILIVFALVMAISVSQLSEDKSDNSGSYRCENCGGDGWDSANDCSCVWCGGDGRTSWNP